MELNVFDYLRVFRRNWLLIVVAVAVGTLGAMGVVALKTPSYTASTQLFVSIQGSGSVSELNQGSLFSQERVQTYVETVKTPMVLQPVIDKLDLDETPESLSSRVTSQAGSNTVLLTISVEDSAPDEAARIANAVGDSLKQVVVKLETPETGESSLVQVSTVKPAIAPSAPSSPRVPLIVGLGVLVGLALGLGVSVLRTMMDTRVRAEDSLRRVTDAPLLGKIANDDDAQNRPLITQAEPQSPRVESFKQLRTNLHFSRAGGALRSILFTSSLPEEGKTTTSVNTAISMSDAGLRVLLIDGDLRRPRIAKYLGLEGSVGLTTYLVGQMNVQDAVQPWGEKELYVLTSGRIPPNPSELLGSEQMKELISQAESEFDVVIIDGPPLLPVADSAVISRVIGGVVLIVGAHKAKAAEVEKALDSLRLVDAKLLGVVMNRLPTKGADAYRASYYGSEAGTIIATTGSPSAGWKSRGNKKASSDTRIVHGEEPASARTDDRNLIDDESESARRYGRRAVDVAFDLREGGEDGGAVMNSSSRPLLRSSDDTSFEEALQPEGSSRRRMRSIDRREAARHVRR